MRKFDIVIDRGKFIQHTIHRDGKNNIINHCKTSTYLLKLYYDSKFNNFGFRLLFINKIKKYEGI
jgi:hypothetical protein